MDRRKMTLSAGAVSMANVGLLVTAAQHNANAQDVPKAESGDAELKRAQREVRMLDDIYN